MSAPTLACPLCGAPLVTRIFGLDGAPSCVACLWSPEPLPAAVEVERAGGRRLPGFEQREGEG